jgi:hypothetical protein
MPPSLLPEFFAILGTDIFLAMSLLTCLLDRHLPRAMPYIYQIVALAGFGHLLVSRGFWMVFDEHMRFWYCFFYLLVALANVLAVNLYLLRSKKLQTIAKGLFGAVTAPVILVAAFFVSTYASEAPYPLVSLPSIPLEVSYVAMIAFDVAVIAVGLSAFFNINWNRVALISSALILGTTLCTLLKPPGWSLIVLTSAVLLGVACAIVLSTSIYVLVRTRREAMGKT